MAKDYLLGFVAFLFCSVIALTLDIMRIQSHTVSALVSVVMVGAVIGAMRVRHTPRLGVWLGRFNWIRD